MFASTSRAAAAEGSPGWASPDVSGRA